MRYRRNADADGATGGAVNVTFRPYLPSNVYLYFDFPTSPVTNRSRAIVQFDHYYPQGSGKILYLIYFSTFSRTICYYARYFRVALIAIVQLAKLAQS